VGLRPSGRYDKVSVLSLLIFTNSDPSSARCGFSLRAGKGLSIKRPTATSREARIPIERRQGYVWTIKDGKAIRFRWFSSPEHAFEALGIEP
jgi:hypothetical protein